MKVVVNRDRPNKLYGALSPVQVLSRYFSRVSSWVATEVVSCTSVPEAVARLTQLILIMKVCVDVFVYVCECACVSG
jgi:RasGEF domain